MIMEKYKEELNSIHAPEDLILRTLSRVHEEEEKIKAEEDNKITDISDNYIYRNNADNSDNTEYIDNTEKISVFKKYNKIIKMCSTLVAAAIVLIIAINIRSLKKNNYETTNYSDSADYAAEEAAYSDEAEEADADEADYSDDADEAVYNKKADETDHTYESSNASAAADETAESAETTESAASESEGASSDIYYNEMADEVTEDRAEESSDRADESANIAEEPVMEEMSIYDYSSYLGLDLGTMLAPYSVDSQYIYAKTSEDKTELADDYCRFAIKKDSGDATLTISKTRQLGVESLKKGVPSSVNGREVYVGQADNGNVFYALINLDGVNALLNTKNISRYEFEEMLKNFTR
ncbi:hypothetical protein SAMN06297422_12723 [Lachnospiraceae bacterium]|nr:hypothetical protein SAMN06297422_12723 [Lachnospiraceae bacterium]